jgi:hypothetical protein
MSKDSPALQALPSGAASALRALGTDLATARKRRRQSQREWAQRLTVARMERGDPSVSAGIYVTALWLVQRHQALAELARPQEDLAVLEAEVSQAQERYRRV